MCVELPIAILNILLHGKHHQHQHQHLPGHCHHYHYHPHHLLLLLVYTWSSYSPSLCCWTRSVSFSTTNTRYSPTQLSIYLSIYLCFFLLLLFVQCLLVFQLVIPRRYRKKEREREREDLALKINKWSLILRWCRKREPRFTRRLPKRNAFSWTSNPIEVLLSKFSECRFAFLFSKSSFFPPIPSPSHMPHWVETDLLYPFFSLFFFGGAGFYFILFFGFFIFGNEH